MALVTGGARRLGRAIALELAARGWDVAVHCHRSREEAEEVAGLIRAAGRRAAVLQADLADEAATAGLIAACTAALGVPTCPVNNASLFQYDVATSFSYGSLDTHMRTNVAAPLLLARELHKALGSNKRGVVINLLDQKLNNLNPDFLSYTLSKAALQTATMQLAQALAPAARGRRGAGHHAGVGRAERTGFQARPPHDAARPVVHAGGHRRCGGLPGRHVPSPAPPCSSTAAST